MVCAVCAEEYFLAPSGCLPCSDASATTLVAIIFTGVAAAAAVLAWITAECCGKDPSKTEEIDESNISIELEELEGNDTKGWTDHEQKSGNTDQASPSVEQGDFNLDNAVGSIKNTAGDIADLAEGAAGDIADLAEGAADDIVNMAEVAFNSDAVQAGIQAFQKGFSVLTMVKDKIMSSMGHFKIVFGVLQIISTFLSSLAVPWPSFFESWAESIQFVNLGVFDVASVQCMRPESDYYDKLLMQMVTPILLTACLWGALKFRVWRSVCKDPNDMFKLARLKMKIGSQHMFVFLFLLFVVYPGAIQ